jgi:pimeloyl-ACP methyl ester carboxylesterase
VHVPVRNLQVLAILTALLALNAIAAPDYARDGNKAPDYAREARWADDITPTLVVGDAVYLEQRSGHKFLALYTEAKKARAAVIVVHGLGVHPDWALIGVLRSALPDYGYTTLSVQMPVLAADAQGEQYPALFADASERLAAAVVFLKAKGYSKIALASHSMGARMSNYFLAARPDHGIATWVAIGTSSGEFADAEKFSLPILDIYGERDFPQVMQKADARAAVLKKRKGSAQIEVPGADHFFSGSEGELVRHIRLFLDRPFSQP